MVHEIRLTFSLDPRRLRGPLAFLILALLPFELGSETLTLTTTYPAPSGIYNRLITTGNGNLPIGNNTILNQSGGNLVLAPSDTNPTDSAVPEHGYILIGTRVPDPNSKSGSPGVPDKISADAIKLQVQGDIWMAGTRRIRNVADPLAAQDVATRQWVENNGASGINPGTGTGSCNNPPCSATKICNAGTFVITAVGNTAKSNCDTVSLGTETEAIIPGVCLGQGVCTVNSTPGGFGACVSIVCGR